MKRRAFLDRWRIRLLAPEERCATWSEFEWRIGFQQLMVIVDSLLRDRVKSNHLRRLFRPSIDEQTSFSQVTCHNHWTRHLQRLDSKSLWAVAQDALWHQEAPYGGIATLAYHHCIGSRR